jgi:hypothetical protein
MSNAIHIDLETEAGIDLGHPWIVVPDTDEGRALVQLLTSGQPLVHRGSDLLFPHDANVDQRMVQLIDQLAHVRYQSPDLIQLTLKEMEE